MSTFKWFAPFVLAIAMVSTLPAESHCPGNVPSLHVRLINRSQILVPVTINHSGPYDFLLDTGADATLVDRSLAAELHLPAEGAAQVVGVGSSTSAFLSRLDRLEVGSEIIVGHRVVVQDLERAADLHIRGILGSTFLGHFDLLIDNAHEMLCIDDTRAMQSEIKSRRINLAPAPHRDAFAPILVAVRLSAVQAQLLLEIDSGSNVPFLYDTGKHGLPARKQPMQGAGIDGAQRRFAVLPPQDMQIGPLTLHQLSFVVLGNPQKNLRRPEVDGLLTTGLFRQVYISYPDRFIALNPW